jgi:hypothetical protein
MKNSYAEGIAVGVEKAVGVAILRRRQFYADGQLRGLPKTWPTPTTPTFSHRRRCRPSAPFTIPVVMVFPLIFWGPSYLCWELTWGLTKVLWGNWWTCSLGQSTQWPSCTKAKRITIAMAPSTRALTVTVVHRPPQRKAVRYLTGYCKILKISEIYRLTSFIQILNSKISRQKKKKSICSTQQIAILA